MSHVFGGGNGVDQSAITVHQRRHRAASSSPTSPSLPSTLPNVVSSCSHAPSPHQFPPQLLPRPCCTPTHGPQTLYDVLVLRGGILKVPAPVFLPSPNSQGTYVRIYSAPSVDNACPRTNRSGGREWGMGYVNPLPTIPRSKIRDILLMALYSVT